MDQTILSEEQIGMEKKSLALQQDRSAVVRTNIKRYYIYFVLALVVVIFSVVKAGRGRLLRAGALSQSGQHHQPAAYRRAHHDRERRIHVPDDRGTYRPVHRQRHEPERRGLCPG